MSAAIQVVNTDFQRPPPALMAAVAPRAPTGTAVLQRPTDPHDLTRKRDSAG